MFGFTIFLFKKNHFVIIFLVLIFIFLMNDKGRQVIIENVTAKYRSNSGFSYGQGVLKSAIFDKAEFIFILFSFS